MADYKNCLNQEFWDEAGQLREDIHDILVRIADDVLNDIEEDIGLKLEPDGIIFTGSLTGPNWDDTSDVDLHFLIDFEKYDEEFLAPFLHFYAKSFNENEFTILDHSLEIYFQDKDEPHQSPGIYDIDNNEWKQVPDCVEIEITNEHRERSRTFLDEINDFREDWDSGLINNNEQFLEDLKEYWKTIKDYRAKGLASEEGMYSFENIVFKMLRRNNALKTFIDLMRDVKDNIYDVYREDFNSAFNWLDAEIEEEEEEEE
jgi:hypothetical protein